MTRGRAAVVAAVLAALAVASSASAAPAGDTFPDGEPRYRATTFDPAVEARDFANTQQRAALYSTPAYQALLRRVGARNNVAALRIQATDPEREFVSDLCWSGMDGCAGDVRLYDWQAQHYGIVRPVLFTARNGAQLSGHVWATRRGPARRPGVVITPGSVQATEQMYWYAAQALAKHGYVVLTFDAQGQGQSDTFGRGPDRMEGVPAQTDGRPFFDGTEDALSFFLSRAAEPYVPVRSCETGTSHAAYQRARVEAGRDAAYNPFASILDRTRIGLAGHSYGASGVSYIGQWDQRVDAVVAWDNLGPADPSAEKRGGPAEKGCVDKAARRRAPLRVPALGMSVDYGLPPTPHTSLPAYDEKAAQSLVYSRRRVDTGEIVIRGGSHLDYSFIPNPAFGASLRGPDVATWYTNAWFDYYVKGDRSAYRRLVTRRWHHDARMAAVDSYGDGNAFSYYYRSRLDITRPGGRPFRCETLRRGCRGMVATDGFAGVWSYLREATTRDGRATHPVPNGTGIYAG